MTTLNTLRDLAKQNATVNLRRGGRQSEIKTGFLVASEGREFLAAGQRFDANEVSFIDLGAHAPECGSRLPFIVLK